MLIGITYRGPRHAAAPALGPTGNDAADGRLVGH
jgi:hypothetical protein